MLDTSFGFNGFDDLEDDFQRLAKAAQGKVTRDASRAGAKVARDKIRAGVPVRTGLLKRSFVVAQAGRGESPGAATAGVRVRKVGAAKRGTTQDPFYWKFVELGTANMPSHPYVRPAWDGGLEEIVRAASDALGEGIDRAILGG